MAMIGLLVGSGVSSGLVLMGWKWSCLNYVRWSKVRTVAHMLARPQWRERNGPVFYRHGWINSERDRSRILTSCYIRGLWYVERGLELWVSAYGFYLYTGRLLNLTLFFAATTNSSALKARSLQSLPWRRSILTWNYDKWLCSWEV